MATILRGEDNVDSSVIVETNGLAVTDNAIPRFDGTTGKLQDSLITVSDTGIITATTDLGGTSIQFKGRALDDSSGVYFLSNSGEEFGGIGYRGSIAPAPMSYNAYKDGCYHEWRTQNARKMILDSSGNLLLVSGTGALGYGAGAGGSVTQLTSKSTTVTLNKPCGTIIMNNAALAGGTGATFQFNNSLLSSIDNLECTFYALSLSNQGAYTLEKSISNGVAFITVTNRGGSTFSDNIYINFSVIKGATA